MRVRGEREGESRVNSRHQILGSINEIEKKKKFVKLVTSFNLPPYTNIKYQQGSFFHALV